MANNQDSQAGDKYDAVEVSVAYTGSEDETLSLEYEIAKAWHSATDTSPQPVRDALRFKWQEYVQNNC